MPKNNSGGLSLQIVKIMKNRYLFDKGNLVHRFSLITGLPGKSSHEMGFRSSVSKNGHPGEGKHEGLVRRNDVLTNGFIGFSLA